jgi:hypothetical protein
MTTQQKYPYQTMLAICERLEGMATQMGIDIGERIDRMIDLEKAWENTGLDLDGLLAATDADFAHDLFGIIRHMNRHTGKLGHCFVPRYARS